MKPSVKSKMHHVGLTVSNLDASLAFWERFLDTPCRVRAVLDRPYLGTHVGYPGVEIEIAVLDLPGGNLLELLEYRIEERATIGEETANPGHMHICLAVDDIQEVWRRAMACGARPVVAEGPVDVDGGPNKGARTSYLRVPPDWSTLELIQPAPDSMRGE